MILSGYKRAIGTFSTYRGVESALSELRDHLFPAERISIIGRELNRSEQTGNPSRGDLSLAADKQVSPDSGMEEVRRQEAATGSALGGLTGLLVGIGALAIPGLGTVVLGGTVATILTRMIAGGAIGAAAGGLMGGLIGLGVPEAQARLYSERVSRGDYLIMVDGSEAEIRRAEVILKQGGIADWGVYNTLSDSLSNSARRHYDTISADGSRNSYSNSNRRDPLL